MIKETRIKILEINKIAILFRIKVKKRIKKEITDKELENWYRNVLEISEKLITEKAGKDNEIYQALNDFKDIMPNYPLITHVDRIRKYLNKLLNCFDKMYPIIFKRFFQEGYDKKKFQTMLELIVQ